MPQPAPGGSAHTWVQILTVAAPGFGSVRQVDRAASAAASASLTDLSMRDSADNRLPGSASASSRAPVPRDLVDEVVESAEKAESVSIAACSGGGLLPSGVDALLCRWVRGGDAQARERPRLSSCLAYSVASAYNQRHIAGSGEAEVGAAPRTVPSGRGAPCQVRGAWSLVPRPGGVMAIDGAILDVPDTPANFSHFGKTGNHAGPSAFPQVRIVGPC
jgi:hypothetical protein